MKTPKFIAICLSAMIVPLSTAYACGGTGPGMHTDCMQSTLTPLTIVQTIPITNLNETQAMNQVNALTKDAPTSLSQPTAPTHGAKLADLAPSAGGSMSCESSAGGILTICGFKTN